LIIIGIGNTLRADDGIGCKIIEELKTEQLPKEVELVDIGSDTFSLVGYFEKKLPVLVIDCAQMDKVPGTVIKFDIEESDLPVLDKAIFVHGFGFSEIYKMAKSLYGTIDCTIIGIQPKSIEFNRGLSKVVEEKIPFIKNMVIEEIKKHAKKDYHN
jgi:hydrogenase maturation protease